MKSIVVLFVVLCFSFIGSEAYAGNVIGGSIITASSPPPVSYVGPGDITAFTAWYSCTRAYSAAVAAANANACDLRRLSDNATCTVKLATDGSVDLTVGTPCNGGTQTVTAWIGVGSAFVSKLYDQTQSNGCSSASCDVIQASTGAQPKLLLTGCGVGGTLPCLSSFGSTTNVLTSANSLVEHIVASSSMVASNDTPAGLFLYGGGSNNWLYMWNAGNWSTNGGLHVSTTASAWHAVNAAVNGASSAINKDGTEVTGNVNAASATTAISVMDVATSGSTLLMGEIGLADNVGWVQGTRGALCANQAAFYGTAVGATCS